MNFKRIANICLFITFLLIVCSNKLRKQTTANDDYIPYYLEIYKIDSLRIIGENEKAFNKLDSLFKKYKPLNQDFYGEMVLYLKLSDKLNKKIDGKKISEELIRDWGLTSKRIKKDSILSNIIHSYLNKNEIILNENNFKNKIDSSYRKEIIKMFEADQKSRGKENEAFIDEDNVKRLIKLIKEKGYPNKERVGDLLSERVSLGIMYFHLSRTDYYNEIKSVLFDNLKKGNSSPDDIKKFVEAKYILFYKYDYFGDADDFRQKNQTTSIDTFNLRRKKYGLPSLSYSRWKMDKILKK